MATNAVLRKLKIEYSFQSGVYVPTGNNDLSDGSPTVVDLSLDEGGTGLADIAAVNSDQLDLTAVWPETFTMIACLEWFAAVTAGGTVDFYWSYSANSGVGVGNPGSPDGIDGLYAPSGFTDDEGVRQMFYIGSHINNGNIAPQISVISTTLSLPTRFGQLVVFNDSGTLLCGTDDIESSVLMYGYIPDIQAAA